MKKILFVEDDPVIVMIYRKKFLQAGFEVEVAEDGLSAMTLLPKARPDAVVLDLMMPKFSGVEVLKFMRSSSDLKDTPVVILSNSYMTDLAQEAANLGADKALLKASCTPALLLDVINGLRNAAAPSGDTSVLLAVPPPRPVPAVPPPQAVQPAPAPAPPPPPVQPVEADTEFQGKVHRDFLDAAPETLKTIRELAAGFSKASDARARSFRLADLHRKVHFLSSLAGLAGCTQIAHLSSALEAMLFELQEKPAFINASTFHTINDAVAFLAELFDLGEQIPTDDVFSEEEPAATVLVVDDDALANRAMVAALNRAHLKAASLTDPRAALAKLQETTFDMVLLDVSMPEMDGFELCARLRALPQYEKTPVIFVTSHSDFENRAKGIRSGGDDLIGKPVFPIELAVKVVSLLIKRQLAAQAKN